MARKIPRSFRVGKLTFKDGTAVTPISLEITTCNGDLTFKPGQAEVKEVKRRGALSEVYKGDEAFGEISFSCDWIELKKETGDPAEAAWDFIVNQAGTLVSTRGGNVFCFDIEVEISNPDSTGMKEKLVFDDCFVKGGAPQLSEGDPNTISFVLGTFSLQPTVTRV